MLKTSSKLPLKQGLPAGSAAGRLAVSISLLAAAALSACGGGTISAAPEKVQAAHAQTAPTQGDLPEDAVGANLRAPVDWGMGPGVELSSMGSLSRMSVSALAGAPAPESVPPGGVDAGVQGMFGPAFTWPIIPIHAVLLADGRVLSYGTNDLGQQTGQFQYALWDPALGTGPDAMQLLPNVTGTDIFCAGQTLLPSGDVMILGGDRIADGKRNWANADYNVFMPASNALVKQSTPMAYQRWYPTVVTTAQGEQVAMGGRIDRAIDDTNNGGYGTIGATYATTPEIWNAATGWRTLTTATHNFAFGSDSYSWYYPKAWAGPDGNVMIVTPKGDVTKLTLDGTGSTAAVAKKLIPVGRYTLPAVMYEPGKVLSLRRDGATSLVDLNPAVPTATVSGTISQERIYGNTTVLPDGTVWANGGSTVPNELTGAALHSESWNPATGLWTTAASASVARLYHSVSFLLPDGTVFTGGGGAPGPLTNMNAEIYYPPYLYKKDGSGLPADRPEIVSAPTTSTWGSVITLKMSQNAPVTRVALLRFGAVTHNFYSDQRAQVLQFQRKKAKVQVQLPASANEAPPGYYMLFVFDAQGVPSVAKIIKLS